jgi:hypothetical protein
VGQGGGGGGDGRGEIKEKEEDEQGSRRRPNTPCLMMRKQAQIVIL